MMPLLPLCLRASLSSLKDFIINHRRRPRLNLWRPSIVNLGPFPLLRILFFLIAPHELLRAIVHAIRSMPTRRRVGPYQVALAVARLLGWLASLSTLLALSYLVRRWPDKGGTAAAAFLGLAVALLTDSWEMIAQLDPTYNFPPMKAPRAVMHDLFSLAVTVGGLMLMLFADLREERAAQVEDGFEKGSDWDAKRNLMDVAQWMLAVVAILRFIFAIWSGCACTQARRAHARRNGRHGRRRRRAAEPGIMDLIREGTAARAEQERQRRQQQGQV